MSKPKRYENPEKYPNLIVRVWGWSGYWKELDNVYREHILRRVEYSNGKIIYLNYSSEEVIIDGVTIPAIGYIVIGKEAK